MRREFEKPQKGNPHQLTIQQHVWPLKSISRFCNVDGAVSLFDKALNRTRPAAPDDRLFCARRVWDQRAERGYTKQIEDRFQALVGRLLKGAVAAIDGDDKTTVDAFFALWKARADYRDAGDAPIQLNGVTGETFSQDQEEQMEKHGVSFLRKGGLMPRRFLHSIRMHRDVDAYREQISASPWAIIRTLQGQFLVLDYPAYSFIPIAPTLCLYFGTASGWVAPKNLAEINEAMRAGSRRYFFAQDLSDCP